MMSLRPIRPALAALLAVSLAAGAVHAQPPADDPVADLLSDDASQPTRDEDWNPAWDEPARPAGDEPTGQDTSAMPDAQERALGWQNSADEPPPTPAEDPEVSITQQLNQGVAETNMAADATDFEARARWEAETDAVSQVGPMEQTEYQRALEQHARTVAAQQAEYDARMAAWRAQADACRSGVREACVTWHRER